MFRRFDRKQYFHPVVEIARHPVGAGKVKLFFAAATKIQDAAMFQKAADNAADCDATTHTGNAGTQRADATDDQIDCYAG